MARFWATRWLRIAIALRLRFFPFENCRRRRFAAPSRRTSVVPEILPRFPNPRRNVLPALQRFGGSSHCSAEATPVVQSSQRKPKRFLRLIVDSFASHNVQVGGTC